MDTPSGGTRKRSLFVGFLILALLVAGFLLLITVIPFKGGGNLSLSTLGSDKIGLIEVFGVITSATETVAQIEEYVKDDSIKGILVHIDSPGGAVAPSQEIHQALVKARKKKKVVASMGAVAASGGYYIAIGADKIVANPGTVTGSIGVIVNFMDVRTLMETIGLKAITVKSGKFKDIGSSSREFTEEDRAVLQNVIDDIHSQFVAAVADGRNLDVEEVKKLADGRVYSGKQSLGLGLVDSLGGYADALKLLAELAGISDEPVVVKKEDEFSFLRKLIEGKLGILQKKMPLMSPGFYYLWTLS